MFEVKKATCPLVSGGGCSGEWCPLFVPGSADVKNPTAGDCLYALNQAVQFKVQSRALEILDGMASADAPAVPGFLGPLMGLLGGGARPGKKPKGGKSAG